MKSFVVFVAFVSAALARESSEGGNGEPRPVSKEALLRPPVNDLMIGVRRRTALRDSSEADTQELAAPARHINAKRPGHETYKPPSSFDWRTSSGGIITPVKDQGSCSASYAFAATAAVEAFIKWKYGTAYNLSEQAIVDCSYGKYSVPRGRDKREANKGCQGGRADNALKYLQEHGLTDATKYPYTGVQGTCNTPETISDFPKGQLQYYQKSEPDDNNLRESLIKEGPFIATLNLDGDLESQFRGHKNTVFNPSHDVFTSLGKHSVLVVGYGTEGKTPYWIIKNSWGTGWGEGGYGKIHRGSNKLNILRSVFFIKQVKNA